MRSSALYSSLSHLSFIPHFHRTPLHGHSSQCSSGQTVLSQPGECYRVSAEDRCVVEPQKVPAAQAGHGMRRGRTLSRCISCSLTKLTLPYRLAGTALWQSGCFLTPWWACRYSIPFYWRGSGAAHLLPVNWTLLDRDSLLLIGADAEGGG